MKDINIRFDEKIKELNDLLPKVETGANCAELTLTSILDILGIDNHIFHNLAIPLAGGFGGYKSKSGWQGACGAVSGGCAAIGVILGGNKKMDNETMWKSLMRASQFASEFEKEFSTVVCPKLCGYDLNEPGSMEEYQKNRIWETKCFRFVVWAVDNVRKLTSNELKENWK